MNADLDELAHFRPEAVLRRAQVVALFALRNVRDQQGSVWQSCVSQIVVDRHIIPEFVVGRLCCFESESESESVRLNSEEIEFCELVGFGGGKMEQLAR